MAGPIHRYPYRLISTALLIGLLVGSGLGRERRRSPEAFQVIQLPHAKMQGQLSFEKALHFQAQPHRMTATPLNAVEIGQLAWAAQGLTAPVSSPLSTQQSEEATGNPSIDLKLYFINQEGVFLYHPSEHQLHQVLNQDQRAALILTAVNPLQAAPAACGIVVAAPIRSRSSRLTAVLKRTLLMETGQIAQNIRLQAACLDIVTATSINFDKEAVGTLCNLPRNTEALCILFAGYRSKQSPEQATNQTNSSDNNGNQSTKPRKRVILVVPAQGFIDQELFETQQILNKNGIDTLLASTHIGVVTGVKGGTGQSQLTLEQVAFDQAHAIIFIGGPGIFQLIAQPQAVALAKRSLQQGILVGATSTAPVLLAHTGLLQKRRVTAAPEAQVTVQQANAILTNNAVEQDQNLLTTRDPSAITAFARLVVSILKSS